MSSQLQNKLLHYEAEPPAEVWNKIAATLDDTAPLSVSEKLYRFEALPSGGIWEKIRARIDEQTKEVRKAVPLFIKYRKPLKYSGAVAAMIIIAVLISLLIGKKTESELTADPLIHKVAKNNSDTAMNQGAKQISQPVTRSLQKHDEKVSLLKNKIVKSRRMYPENSFSLPEDFLTRMAERNPIVNASVLPEKYMIYSDEDGNAVRLPKKIFSAFACPVDNYDCKQRLKDLREKFASSALTPDFTGILEILKTLQENQ